MRVDPKALRIAIVASRIGGQPEMDALVEQHLGTIVDHAVSQVRAVNEEAMADARQEALIAVWVHIPKVDVSRNPYAFLRRVAYMRALQVAQRERGWIERHGEINDEMPHQRLAPTKHLKVCKGSRR